MLCKNASLRARRDALKQASVEAGILDSLALQKDEYDAYWEHYIAVKEELVATVLQVG